MFPMNNTKQILNNVRPTSRSNIFTKENNITTMMESNNASEFARYDNQYYHNSNTLNNEHHSQQPVHNSSIPAWKMPLSKSFTSTNAANLRATYSNSSDDSYTSNEENKLPILRMSEGRQQPEEDDSLNSPDPYIIQILLPCIICNRTFSPEALERHSKVCTKVNVNDVRIKPPRQQFDSSKYRIKDTKLELFIPPPAESPGDTTLLCHQDHETSDWVFQRGTRGRSSLQDRNGNARSSFGKGSGWNRRSTRATSVPKSESFGDFDDGASSINTDHDFAQRSYSKAMTPSEDCPYCGRSFGLKAYDRHVNHCKEVWERKQYEIQPTPKEVEVARLRQEIRTKYKPMKGSSSLTSLRSYSPSKENFATNALNRLFGGLKRVENINLHGKGASAMLSGFKKSNESLASSSYYGDFSRTGSTRRRNPSTPSTVMSSSLHQPSTTVATGSSSIIRPGTLRLNTSSNIPTYVDKTKSTENLNAAVKSSGYGPGGNYMSNFSRNSKTRSSLNKNYFRSSSNRVEPEGTENTDTAKKYMNTNHNVENYRQKESNDESGPPPLIITPMNFYTKPGSGSGNTIAASTPLMSRSYSMFNATKPTRQTSHNGNNAASYFSSSNQKNNEPKSSLNGPFTKDGSETYDPYEKAAKQLEELFRKQPPPIHRNSRAARKIGLDHAFASVLGIGSTDDNGMEEKDDNWRNDSSKRVLQVHETNDNDQESFLPSFDLSSNETSNYYWDELLKKRPTTNSGQYSNNDKSTGRYDSSDLKSQHRRLNQSSSKPLTDKSARGSNTSSADSAFSRSDGTDLEFEALESLLEVGQEPSSTFPSSNTRNGVGETNNAQRARADSSEDEPMAMSSSSSSTSSGQGQHGRRTLKALSDSNKVVAGEYETKEVDEGEESIIKTTITPFSGFHQDRFHSQQEGNNKLQLRPTLAKFCHECGTSYPTSEAKFCPECGERRVIHV